jgi:hypothetical protein
MALNVGLDATFEAYRTGKECKGKQGNIIWRVRSFVFSYHVLRTGSVGLEEHIASMFRVEG